MSDQQGVQLNFEVNVATIRENGLFVAIPMYGGVCYGSLTKSLMDLTTTMTAYGVSKFKTKFLYNESLIPRARNYLVDAFLQSDCKQMLFIDADIEFNPSDVLVMADLQNKNPDFDVLCAAYPKKSIAWEKVKAAVDKGFGDEDPDKLENFIGDYVFNAAKTGSFRITEPVEVAESGTGFMMIRRETFERFAKRFPDHSYRPDHPRQAMYDGSREVYAFFDCIIDRGDQYYDLRQRVDKLIERNDPSCFAEIVATYQRMKDEEAKASKRYLSEDYFFCRRVRQAGMKVWLAPWIQLKHNGYYSFGGSLSALAAAGQNVAVDVSKIKKK